MAQLSVSYHLVILITLLRYVRILQKAKIFSLECKRKKTFIAMIKALQSGTCMRALGDQVKVHRLSLCSIKAKFSI